MCGVPPQSAYAHALQSCVCKNGLTFFNGTCIACGDNQKWNATQNKCVCNDSFCNATGSCAQFPTNSVWNGSACACVNNYKMHQNICVLCGSNEYYNGVACVCLDSFSRFNGVCSCPLNSQLMPGGCVCNSNFTMSNSICVQATPTDFTCPDKAAWGGKQCICIH